MKRLIHERTLFVAAAHDLWFTHACSPPFPTLCQTYFSSCNVRVWWCGVWTLPSEWRREYQARLEAKRAASRQAIQGRKEAAAKAISEYYEMKETTREAKLSAGRSVLTTAVQRWHLRLLTCPGAFFRTSEQTVFARLDEVAAGNTWDRVLSLVREAVNATSCLVC